MGPARRLSFIAAVLLLAGACGGNDTPKSLSGYELEPAPVVAAVSLPDASAGGSDFAFRAGDDRLLLVYFGYTYCPDVCPTTLADIRNALKQLGGASDRIDVAMVTVDPARDTDEVITGYVQSFIPAAHALRTDDQDALQAAATAFGASYGVTTADDGTIEVSHSAATYAVDSTGTVVLTWPFGISADAIATDLKILLDRNN